MFYFCDEFIDLYCPPKLINRLVSLVLVSESFDSCSHRFATANIIVVGDAMG